VPIIIKSSYTKKLGLPGYSSHSYSLTVETELSDISQLDRQSAQLYATLQSSVDRELQETGFCPNGNGSPAPPINGQVTEQPRSNCDHSLWACSEKQKTLILKLVDDFHLDKNAVEERSKQLFEKPVKVLNRLEASGLIESLLQEYGPSKSNGGNGNGKGRRQYQRGGARQ
jgi:hypothetical protein